MEKYCKIAIDTNALLYIEKFRINIFEQLKEKYGKVKFYVPEKIMQELNLLSKKNKTLKKHIIVAKKLMKKYNVSIKNISALNADEALLKLAQKNFIILTNDIRLRNKIKKLGGKILIIRQKKFVEEF